MLSNNVILSPADDRDFPVTAALDISRDPIPEDFELWTPPNESQGATGNCVAQAFTAILESAEHQRNGEHKDYSVGYIYGTPHSSALGSGMHCREACNAVLKDGDVYRDIWECFDENPLCREKRAALPQEIHDKAQKLISGYIRLNTKEEMQRYMLRYKLPALIVAPGNAYWLLAGSSLHATVCYGWISEKTYQEKYGYSKYEDLLFHNSWGQLAAKGTIKYEEIKEMWGVIPMDNNKGKFADVDGHWAERFIQRCRELGLVNGYEDNTVRPENDIKRGEAFKIVAELADMLLDKYDDLNTRLIKAESRLGLK